MSQNPIRRTPRPADTGKLEGLPVPSFVVCDNGREFVGRTLREACNLLSIRIERPVLRKKIGKVEA